MWFGASCEIGNSVQAADFPAPDMDVQAKTGEQKAVLAGGCFWCTEAVFEQLEGVKSVVSGYAGGKSNDAKYDVVSAGRTDHAEAIEITYDASKISFGEILKVFFSVAHDPTQKDRQGPDWGRQYRSEIFYANDEQKKVAEAYMTKLNAAKVFGKPIVTGLSKLDKFYVAEKYHQDFVKNNPNHPYVVVNALPKVEKTRKTYQVKGK